MASRTRKSTTVPVKKTAVFSYILELPGAEFLGDVARADVDYALRMQRIRASYENDGDQELLWLDCQDMGFESNEIREFVTNPAAITNCRYGAGALR
jgi:hypothetical protein